VLVARGDGSGGENGSVLSSYVADIAGECDVEMAPGDEGAKPTPPAVLGYREAGSMARFLGPNEFDWRLFEFPEAEISGD